MLDEPSGQLDPAGFVLVEDVIQELKAGGTTVIIATHQLARAASVADEAMLLEAGRVVWRGGAAEGPRCGGVSPHRQEGVWPLVLGFFGPRPLSLALVMRTGPAGRPP